MLPLILTALLAQSADAALSCHQLTRPHHAERNPILGSTCGQILVRKSIYLAPLAIPSTRLRKGWSIGLISGGALGVGLTLALK